MSRHYSLPILLIEFDSDKAFALHSVSEIGADISVGILGCCHATAVVMRPTANLSCASPHRMALSPASEVVS